MDKTHKILAEMFHGDEELAHSILLETDKIKKSTEDISKMLNENLSVEENKKMIKALAESYGELVSGVILPVKFKFPNLDNNS